MHLIEDLTKALQKHFPNGEVAVNDPMNDGAHLSAIIITSAFEGKPHIARHRMVYAALGNAFETKLHALQLTTKTPQETKND